MYKKLLFFISISFSIIAQKSPKEFLGYELGEQFTYHHQIVDYAKYIATSNTQNFQWVSYGKTNERRELGQLIITSPGLQSKLEALKKTHLQIINGEAKATSETPLIINLSFNVHGNEAAGSEAALGLMYDLAIKYNELVQKMAGKSFVILLDPCINPDGREAYATQFNRKNYFSGGNPDPLDHEHFEGKVSGRYNHFLHDLNRDWAWQTQIESKQRIAFYQSFMPMLHADFHEQSGQHSYYFPPAAKPYLNFISEGTKQLQESVGKSFAKLFDSKGWTYFTSEVYDLLYPSYGDTYPILNGALAMTLEQGGIKAGLSQKLNNGDTLHFTERVLHHRTLANDLVNWSLENAEQLKSVFYANHEKARNNPTNQFKTYVIPQDQIAKSKDLIDLLRKNRIEMGYVGKEFSAQQPYSFFDDKNIPNYKVGVNDLIISTFQSASPIAQVLLDPVIALEDSVTYDITAWNMFQIHGIKAFGLKEKLVPVNNFTLAQVKNILDKDALGFYFLPQNPEDIELLLKAKSMGYEIVFNDLPLEKDGKKIEAGNFFIFSKNKSLKDFTPLISLADANNIALNSMKSFRFDKGADLGSEHFKYFLTPKVAIIANENFDTNQQGELAYFFKTNFKSTATYIQLNDFFNKPIDHYTHLFIPSSNFKFNEGELKTVQKWISNGGKLICFENSINSFLNAPFDLGKNLKELKDTTESKDIYALRERNALSATIGGNLLEVNLENSHPYGFRNQNSKTYILNTSNTLFASSGDFNPILKTGNSPKVNGFLGSKIKKQISNTVWFGSKEIGKGTISWFNFNPIFRSIPTQGQTIIENILLYANY
ncbi:MAG: hypothetical protein RI995_1923 [Bacteroidota bacterium]|jgi:hypothetical protein